MCFLRTYETTQAPPATVFLHDRHCQIPTECRFTEVLPQNVQVYRACCVISIFLTCFRREAPYLCVKGQSPSRVLTYGAGGYWCAGLRRGIPGTIFASNADLWRLLSVVIHYEWLRKDQSSLLVRFVMSAVIDCRGGCRDWKDCQNRWCALDIASALAWPYQALALILGCCATSML